MLDDHRQLLQQSGTQLRGTTRELPPDAAPARRWSLLNVLIDDYTMPELLDRLDQCGGVVHTFNTDHAYHLHHSSQFLAAYQGADVITMDSNYLFAAMRLRGLSLREPVRGADLADAFLRRSAARSDVRVFLLGARPGVAALARKRINARACRELVVGGFGPSMDFVNDEAEIAQAIAMVNASGANVLMVGLGAPKQECWIAANRHRMPGVRVFLAVGAVIDYQAGVVKRAPRLWRLLAMEWAYRVVSEPRRYLRRYLSNLRVFWWVLLEHRGGYRNPVMSAKDSP